MYRKGGVLYYTICAHVPETQKCVNFVNFVNKCAACLCLFLKKVDRLILFFLRK